MAFSDYGVSPCPEAQTLLRYMSFPAQGRRVQLIDRFIRRLKNSGLWSGLDVLWVLRAHDAQAARLNWKNPASFALTATNSPTFTTDRGYAGNGSSSYLDTGWTPSTNAAQFTQNSASLGVYLTSGVGTDTANSTPTQIGSIGGNGAFLVAWGAASNGIRGRVNASSTAETSSTVSTRYGLSTLDRSGSGTFTGYRDGVSKGGSGIASASIPTQAFSLLALNNGGSIVNFSDNQIGLAFAGASLGATGNAELYSAWLEYVAAT